MTDDAALYDGLKQHVLRALLNLEPVVRLVVWGPGAGNGLPEAWRQQLEVVLELGYQMPVPIKDLVIDDAGVRATLSFARVPYACVVPWSAVIGITGRRFGVGCALPEPLKPQPTRPGLRVVKGGAE